MRKVFYLLIIFFCRNACSEVDEPWFTGPLIAEPAATVAPGEINLQWFDFYITSSAIYGNKGKVEPVEYNVSNQMLPELTIGITPNLDIELQPSLISNYFKGKSVTGVGDTAVILGIQALKQEHYPYQPDLRITLTEVLPSGHYENLSDQNYALNATGLGSYQTGFDLNFQKLIPLQGNHYLNAHWSVGYLYASAVHIQGYSSYGGSALTRGNIKPGSVYTVDLAGELSLSQHWVAVLEAYYQYQDTDRFYSDNDNYGGIQPTLPPKDKKALRKELSRLLPNKHNISSLFRETPKVGNGTMDLFSLAPALEYNFSSKLGIIVGSWFSFYGKNTVDFGSFAIGLNILI
jgi:hypothetical protein